MKKVSTAATKPSRNFSQPNLIIGMDLGDRSSCYCVLDETGRMVMEQKVSTTAKALQVALGGMPRSRIALETGTHSPWVSRLLSGLGHEVIVAHARNVRLIGESRKKDDRLRCANSGPAGAHRSRVALSGEAPQRASASGPDGDPGTSRPGAGPHGAGQHGPRTGQELRRTVARLQCAQHESGKGRGAESGVASRTAAVAGDAGVAERTHRRVQPADREAGARELSAGGVAEAGEGSGHADRADVFADAGRSTSLPQEPRRGLLPGTAAGTKKLRTERAADAHQ